MREIKSAAPLLPESFPGEDIVTLDEICVSDFSATAFRIDQSECRWRATGSNAEGHLVESSKQKRRRCSAGLG